MENTKQFKNYSHEPAEEDMNNITQSANGSIVRSGHLSSSNYVKNNAGWDIDAQGNAEFNNGTFRGTFSLGGTTITVNSVSQIQPAIDQVSADGGGTVFLSSGDYFPVSSITVPSNVDLKGAGSGSTVIDFDNTSNQIQFIGANGYTTGNVSISFGATTVTGTSTVWDSTMVGRSILLQDFWYTISGFTSSVSLDIDIGYNGTTLTNFRYAIATTVDNVKLEGMTVQNSTASLVKMQYVNNIAYNDLVTYNGLVGLDHAYVANVNSLISTADTCGTGYVLNDTVFGTWVALNALNSTGVGVSANYFRNSAFDVFAVQGNAGVGMSFSNMSNVGAENFSLQVNTGIGIEFVTANKQCAFVNGIILNGGSDGIKFTDTTNDIQIVAIAVENNAGWGVNVANSNCNRNVIVANTFVSNTSGAVTDSGTGTVIESNSPASVNVKAFLHARATGQVAANSNVMTATVGSTDTTFQVHLNVLVTTSTTHNFSATIDYTDEGGTSRTLTIPFSQLAGTIITAITNVTGASAYEGVVLTVRAKAATSIVFKTAGTFTSVVYNVDCSLLQIA